MFFSAFLLLLFSSAIRATLPDVNSFMPNFFGMIPMNGRIRFNDQVFSFGEQDAIPNEVPQTNINQNVLPPVPQTVPQMAPQTVSQTVVQTGGPTIQSMLPNSVPQQQMFESRSPQVNGAPFQPLPGGPSNPVPTPPEFVSRIPSNFGSLIPNFQTRNLETPPQNPNTPDSNRQNLNVNSLPNIGSTEIGSTFKGNANSNFDDEFSNPQPGSPTPFGMPPTNQFNAQTGLSEQRPNLNPSEAPVVVMPLVVSPDRLVSPDISASNASTSPFSPLMVSSTDINQRVDLRPFPVRTMSNIFGPITDRKPFTTKDGSKVEVSRQTSFILPPPTVTQTNTQSNNPNVKDLEKHLPPLIIEDRDNSSNIRIEIPPQIETIQTSDNVIPFKFVNHFKPQKIPTFAELDQKLEEMKRSQRTVIKTPSQIIS